MSFSDVQVRINAAFALSCASSRAHYGDSFIRVWSVLADTLAGFSAEDVGDFSELKYRETLLTQLMASFCHVVCLTCPNDLLANEAQLAQVLQDQATSLGTLFRNCRRKLEHDSWSAASASSSASSLSLELLSQGQNDLLQLYRHVDSLCTSAGTPVSLPKAVLVPAPASVSPSAAAPVSVPVSAPSRGFSAIFESIVFGEVAALSSFR